ncbi:MAG: glycosyltransferase [bacterium]|nr:glycosyltransferase [bacterium]
MNPVNVLMLSTDRNAFQEGSAVRARFRDFGTITDTLHIIVLSKGNHRPEAIAENVFLHPTNSRSKWCYLSDAWRIGKGLPRPDLVTAQDPFETGFVGWRLARYHRAKLELQVHTDFLSPYFARRSFPNRVRVFIARFLLPRAAGIRVVSERIASSLKTKNLKLKTAPVVLPVFIDAEKLMSAQPAFDLHARYPQFNFIALTVARLEPEKNVSLGLRAMVRVIKEYPKVGYVIVGEGSERRNLELLTKNLKLEQNVVFAGWQDDTASFYRGADLYLSTSDYEGYGLSLIEAAIHGVPIVATDAGIVGTVLRDGESALVCPPHDAECLAKKASSIILDKEFAKKVKRSATAEALSCLPKDKEAYLEEYKKNWEDVS